MAPYAECERDHPRHALPTLAAIYLQLAEGSLDIWMPAHAAVLSAAIASVAKLCVDEYNGMAELDQASRERAGTHEACRAGRTL